MALPAQLLAWCQRKDVSVSPLPEHGFEGASAEMLVKAMGVGSICEFGVSRPDLAEVHTPLAKALRDAIAAGVRDAQRR